MRGAHEKYVSLILAALHVSEVHLNRRRTGPAYSLVGQMLASYESVNNRGLKRPVIQIVLTYIERVDIRDRAEQHQQYAQPSDYR